MYTGHITAGGSVCIQVTCYPALSCYDYAYAVPVTIPCPAVRYPVLTKYLAAKRCPFWFCQSPELWPLRYAPGPETGTESGSGRTQALATGASNGNWQSSYSVEGMTACSDSGRFRSALVRMYGERLLIYWNSVELGRFWFGCVALLRLWEIPRRWSGG
eukprot:3376741-Rhodomonas_salina.4